MRILSGGFLGGRVVAFAGRGCEGATRGAGGQNSGISAVESDDASQAPEYFNLQGMKVNADALTSGLYIRRQGTRAEKILIR